MKSRYVSLPALTLGALFALTGCGTPPSATELWRADAPVMEPPVVIDGVVIAPVSEGDNDYSMRAWDGATGEQLWSHDAAPWSTGGIAGAWELDDEGRVVAAFMVPRDEGVTWRMVDPRTGSEVDWPPSAARDDLSWPAIHSVWNCDDSPQQRALCFSVPDGDTNAFLRLGPRVSLSTVPFDVRGEGIYRIGYGLYQDLTDPEISLQRQGERVWSVPFSEVFGDEATDRERALGDGVLEHAFLLSTNPTHGDDDVDAWDLTAERTVAVDRETGELLWLRERLSIMDLDVATNVVTGLEYSAGRFERGEDGLGDPVDIAYDIVRVDPVSGQNLWSFAASATTVDETFRDDGYALFDPRGVVIADDEGAHLIDIDSGATEPIPDDVALPCTSSAVLEHSWSLADDDTTIARWGSTTWCDVAHEPLDSPTLDATLVALAGVEVLDDVHVVLEETGLVAYETGE